MRPSTFFLVTPLAGTLVSAGCFTGGADGLKQTAIDQMDTTCKAMQGNFMKNWHHNACVVGPHETTSWYFEVKLTGADSGELTLDACKKGLLAEVNGCSKGGRSTTDGWQFTSDPDSGVCIDNNYIDGHSKRSYPPSKKRVPKIIFDVAQPDRETQAKKEAGQEKRHISFEA